MNIKNALIALLVAGQVALSAVAWSEHTRIAVLTARVSQVELTDYAQETANMEFETQINVEKECLDRLLTDPKYTSWTVCNQTAIAGPKWTYDRPHIALEKKLTTEQVQKALQSSKSLDEAEKRLREAQ